MQHQQRSGMAGQTRYAFGWILGFLAFLSACSTMVDKASSSDAGFLDDFEPASTWSDARKMGIGSSYEAYVDGHFADNEQTGIVSKVWFSMAEGVITETMYGLIHMAQIKDLRLVVRGADFMHLEDTDMLHEISYLDVDEQGRPLAPSYEIRSTDAKGQYVLVKSILSDPDQQSLMVKIAFEPKIAGLQLGLLLDPHMANTSGADQGRASAEGLYAHEGNTHLALRMDRPWQRQSITTTEKGEVLLKAELIGQDSPVWEYQLAVGFGPTQADATAEADASLQSGFEEVRARYLGAGDHVGWQDYLASLAHLPALQQQSMDNGKLASASALVLKVQEDKTHAGALIASLSNPWGPTVDAGNSSSGYKAVWPRDFYQCAMAFLAMGDTQTAMTAFSYLPQVQVSSKMPDAKGAMGWFLQKTRVNGEREWISIQMDQTAMPIMLGWKLWKLGVLDDAQMQGHYQSMLKPAAIFLRDGGVAGLEWNTEFVIKPPLTQQERWEEQWGYSPSTTAAIISGLVAAADMARAVGDQADAASFEAAADSMEASIEALMFTTKGAHGDGSYFMRLGRSDNPNDRALLGDNNGKPGLQNDLILDAGFLELVRYGVRRADADTILASLPELDAQHIEENLRVRYPFETESGHQVWGWRRYGNDGYGEDAKNGHNYGENGMMRAEQRGRVWPFFTGERGHYELSRALLDDELSQQERSDLQQNYVAALESFANSGLMLPEQVFDGVGVNPWGYQVGKGTNSATPLAWTHAEYVKLLRSLSDARVWDRYSVVEERYQPPGR